MRLYWEGNAYQYATFAFGGGDKSPVCKGSFLSIVLLYKLSNYPFQTFLVQKFININVSNRGGREESWDATYYVVLTSKRIRFCLSPRALVQAKAAAQCASTSLHYFSLMPYLLPPSLPLYLPTSLPPTAKHSLSLVTHIVGWTNLIPNINLDPWVV